MTTAAHTRIFVGGSWQQSDDVLEVRRPDNGELVGSTFRASAAQLDLAIQAADDARPALAALPLYQRSAVLRRVCQGMLDARDELAAVLCQEAGKPIRDSRTEIERTALTFRIAAEESERQGGEVIDLGLNAVSAGRLGITRRFPLGVVGGITPFNLPVSLAAHKLAPAMAVGCPIVLKVADEAPLAVLRIAAIIEAAGAPPGSVTVTPASIAVGDRLVTDERIKLLSFTGSARVGWGLKARAGHKRVVLELGGDAAAIVDRSADIAWAARRCVYGAFKYAGQTCISVQRVYVHTDVWEEFVEQFVKGAEALTVGDPMSEHSDIGPVINVSAHERIRDWVAEAVAAGASVLTGGEAPGPLLRPTVLTGVAKDTRLRREEVFGPVAYLEPIEDLESGIAAVNDSRFGLQTGVFTRDIRSMWRAFQGLEVGAVVINDSPTYRIDHMPYGGVKDSGFGREGIRYAMQEMTEARLLVATDAT